MKRKPIGSVVILFCAAVLISAGTAGAAPRDSRHPNPHGRRQQMHHRPSRPAPPPRHGPYRRPMHRPPPQRHYYSRGPYLWVPPVQVVLPPPPPPPVIVVPAPRPYVSVYF